MGPPAVMDAGMSPPLLWAGPGTGLRERESFLSPELSAGPLGDRIRKGGILEISRGPLAHSSASRQGQPSIMSLGCSAGFGGPPALSVPPLSCIARIGETRQFRAKG